MNLGKDRLYLRDDGRFIYAICSSVGFPSFDAQRSPNGAIAAFSLEFTAGDPFWYAGTESESHQLNINTTPFNFSVTNNATMRTPVRVHFTPQGTVGSMTDMRLTNTTTGLYMRYRGTVQVNQTCIIDAER